MLVTASSADELLVFDRWLRPGVFVYSMGEFQEIEAPAYLAADRFYVDDWEHCKLKVDIQTMLAEGSLTDDDVYADLGEVVARSRRTGAARRGTAYSCARRGWSHRTSPSPTRCISRRWSGPRPAPPGGPPDRRFADRV